MNVKRMCTLRRMYIGIDKKAKGEARPQWAIIRLSSILPMIKADCCVILCIAVVLVAVVAEVSV